MHGICPICLWEDDLAQLRFPLMPGGANKVSLQSGQKNFADVGAAETSKSPLARAPEPQDSRDKTWRPLNTEADNVEEPRAGINYKEDYPEDTTVLYYWRATYWRRLSS